MGWQAVESLGGTFRRNPGFEAALALHTDGILALRSRIRNTSKLFGKEERCRSFNIFAVLAADADRLGQPYVALADFLEAARLASVSERTAKTVASLLPYYGFAELSVDEADRRRRLIVPLQTTWTYMAEWAEPTFDALELLGHPLEGDPSVIARGAFASARSEYVRWSQSLIGSDPNFARIFAHLEGGSLMCMAAVAAALNGRPGPSLGEASERFAISKAQLSRVVSEGRACGFFTAAARATPSEAMIRQYSATVSLVFAFVARHRDAAMRSLDDGRDQAEAA